MVIGLKPALFQRISTHRSCQHQPPVLKGCSCTPGQRRRCCGVRPQPTWLRNPDEQTAAERKRRKVNVAKGDMKRSLLNTVNLKHLRVKHRNEYKETVPCFNPPAGPPPTGGSTGGRCMWFGQQLLHSLGWTGFCFLKGESGGEEPWKSSCQVLGNL